MSGIKYYQLSKDEELPDEFCAVKDIGGEPSEYTFYVPEAENAKLRNELANAPKCEACEAMLDCDECLRADGSHKERRRLSTENAKLRKLVESCLRESMRRCSTCLYELTAECEGCVLHENESRLREMGVVE